MTFDRVWMAILSMWRRYRIKWRDSERCLLWTTYSSLSHWLTAFEDLRGAFSSHQWSLVPHQQIMGNHKPAKCSDAIFFSKFNSFQLKTESDLEGLNMHTCFGWCDLVLVLVRVKTGLLLCILKGQFHPKWKSSFTHPHVFCMAFFLLMKI